MSAVLQTKPKLPGLISILLVIALGISLAKLMWLVVAPAPTITAGIQTQDVAVVSQKQQTNYGKLIADQHIFGAVKKNAVVIDSKPRQLAKVVVAPTKLKLKLHGIVAYKSKPGYALISSNNGPQKVYGRGEPIQEGVTVSKILPDKVMLDNRGKTEELLLPVDKNNAKAKPNRRGSSTSGSNTSLSGAQAQKAVRRPAPSTDNADNGAPDLASFREEVISDPSKLMEIVRVASAIVDGKFIGFRIQPGSKRKLFRQLNFRPNDVITEVNGIVLDDASKGAMVLGELAQAADITVKVKRGDQELFIEHSF
jgi:general secretion pathway protein C